VRVIYLFIFIYYENHTQRTVMKKKRQKIHLSTLSAHWVRRNWEGHVVLYGVYTPP